MLHDVVHWLGGPFSNLHSRVVVHFAQRFLHNWGEAGQWGVRLSSLQGGSHKESSIRLALQPQSRGRPRDPIRSIIRPVAADAPTVVHPHAASFEILPASLRNLARHSYLAPVLDLSPRFSRTLFVPSNVFFVDQRRYLLESSLLLLAAAASRLFASNCSGPSPRTGIVLVAFAFGPYVLL